MIDLAPILIPALSFAAVAAVAVVAGHYIAAQARMWRRLPTARMPIEVSRENGFKALHAFVARHFDAKRLGIDGALREKLRRDLLRAIHRFGRQGGKRETLPRGLVVVRSLAGRAHE